jgi:hypothetical protein
MKQNRTKRKLQAYETKRNSCEMETKRNENITFPERFSLVFHLFFKSKVLFFDDDTSTVFTFSLFSSCLSFSRKLQSIHKLSSLFTNHSKTSSYYNA